ncbi:hypothetical protein E5355_10350 [Bacteroides muris (ex Afrizal et al. 2022)]|uniref:Uncharacterized protein n=1 Tax=Bacteroides muris (ex Afrizal et al. 2022) TaxID=2516960 RepID=A0A4S2AZ06_9BACE|nr:hypothetical protein E5355_10350 [Bacteroides muris (ex Afrizal et al. 2022)]
MNLFISFLLYRRKSNHFSLLYRQKSLLFHTVFLFLVCESPIIIHTFADDMCARRILGQQAKEL